ncbi:cytochrome protein [Microdochium trichocladiopsis]|uniref:Cytochrome protein n=1 Tax=Microdochium trichocladiopsis TaxID=1682393 RepID=A0A9P8XWM7_9PEZI|nr:cytochrome protein [Microdochium trichocladiopsis]KAH7016446.1 cytochrome protein [Microdochium trichocladiopsis]
MESLTLTSSGIVALVATGGVVLLLGQKLYKAYVGPLSKIPGPWYAPWTDLVNTYSALTAQKHLYALRLHEKYGPVVRIGPNELLVNSAAGAATIHQVKRPFLKSSWYRKFLPGVENIFNTINPEFHRRHRRLLASPLSESSLQTVFLPRIEAHFDLAISKMQHDINTQGYTDVAKWFLFLTSDVIGELSFGDSFHMLERNEMNQYIRDLQGHKVVRGLRLAFGSIASSPLSGFLPGFRALRKLNERNRMYATQSIERHKALVEKQQLDPEKAGSDAGAKATGVYPTLFQKMYKANDENGETLTAKELVDDAGIFIIAGSDTSSTTLTFLVWAVCRHPEIQKALVEEVAALPEGYTQQDLKDLKFLNLVIQETLRLYAAAPSALPRVVPPSGAEIDGYWLPGGGVVNTTTYALHRDEKVFPDPDKFNPWRWKNPTKEMKNAWMPFGGGTRTCVGIHLAYIEIRLGVARFFREFPHAKISTREGMSDDDMKEVVFFLLSPKGKRCLIEA